MLFDFLTCFCHQRAWNSDCLDLSQILRRRTTLREFCDICSDYLNYRIKTLSGQDDQIASFGLYVCRELKM